MHFIIIRFHIISINTNIRILYYKEFYFMLYMYIETFNKIKINKIRNKIKFIEM